MTIDFFLSKKKPLGKKLTTALRHVQFTSDEPQRKHDEPQRTNFMCIPVVYKLNFELKDNVKDFALLFLPFTQFFAVLEFTKTFSLRQKAINSAITLNSSL